jgi:enamine deaminase RidA (YjgF/YER057c/UK114 family)
MKTRILLIAGLWMIFSCGPSPAENQVNNALEQADAGYNPEEKLTELGLTLDLPAAPAANYVNAVQSGNLVFLAGKGPRTADGQLVTGKLGEDMTVAEGYDAARLVGIAQLAVLKAELGNLKRVKRVVKVLGMVNATPDFTEQPEVVNGFSDLIVEVFGENGKHARAAVGMCSLPRNIAVEVEMVVEVWEEE